MNPVEKVRFVGMTDSLGDLTGSGCSDSRKTHAKAEKKWGKYGASPLTGLDETATITNEEPQQRPGVRQHSQFIIDGLSAARRDSHLIPAGEGDLHRRVLLHTLIVVDRQARGNQLTGTGLSFPRRRG